MDENIIIVDEEDNVIGSKPREVVDKEKLRYRVSSLWITNSSGEILLARRAYSKSHYPGRWGPAVAGTVAEGESYEDNIIKEAQEELGLDDIKPKISVKIRRDGQYNHFTQWFTSVIDKPINQFKLQKEEVAEIKWFSKEELSKMLDSHPEEFIPKMKDYVKLFSEKG